MSSSPEGQNPGIAPEDQPTPEMSGESGNESDAAKLSAAEKLARKILDQTHDPAEAVQQLVDPHTITVRDQLTAVDIVASEVDGIDTRRTKREIIVEAAQNTAEADRRALNRVRTFYRRTN